MTFTTTAGIRPAKPGGRWASAGRWVLAPSVLATALSSGGCSKKPGPPPAPLAAVTVSHPIAHEVIEWDEYSGYMEAPEHVELRPRVSGLVMEAPFSEGTIVSQGTLLYLIDESPFKADLNSKLADVAKAESQLTLKDSTFKRYEEAKPSGGVSAQALDDAKADAQQAKAQVDSARAAATTAKLNLDWCRVVSPIDGRVSNKLVTAGNLVNGGAGQATLLTTIQSTDPMWLWVYCDERSVLKYERLRAEKKRVSARDAEIPCFMALANDLGFPYEGIVDFVDNHIDPRSGTLKARGLFPNPEGGLLPGMFARMRVPGSGRYDAVLVPTVAIVVDQNSRSLLTVDDNDVVSQHPITIGAQFGDLTAIEKGISTADRVIVNGTMVARPGAKVQPHEQPITSTAYQFTAMGSPATQALPATRPFTTAPTTGPLPPLLLPPAPRAKPVVAATSPANSAASRPVTLPTTKEAP